MQDKFYIRGIVEKMGNKKAIHRLKATKDEAITDLSIKLKSERIWAYFVFSPNPRVSKSALSSISACSALVKAGGLLGRVSMAIWTAVTAWL